MITYITTNPSSYVAPATPLTIFGVDRSINYLRVQNNSAYQLFINFSGVIVTISEFWQKDVPIPRGFQGFIIITPTVVILTASHAQAAQLIIQGLNTYDNGGSLDSAIPQQAVTATASGKPLFTASIGFVNTAQTSQGLNVFNPSNSGVTFTFHSARVYTNDTSVPSITMLTLQGADLNYSIAVPAVSHAGIATPPVSFAHCTGQELPGGGGTLIEAMQMPPAPVTQDLLVFPDNVSLAPGANLRIVITTGAVGKAVRLTFKWSEDVAIPPQGGVITGVATSIINEGNPSQNIIQATVQGHAPEDVTLTNSGILSLLGSLSKVIFQNGSISRISISGPFTVAIAGTSCAHNLGGIPDFIIAVNDAGGSQVNNYVINFGTMTITNATVYSTLANVRTWLLAIKL